MFMNQTTLIALYVLIRYKRTDLLESYIGEMLLFLIH